MLAEFDPKEKHAFFAAPFTKTMTTEFSAYETLSWVSEVLQTVSESDTMTANALADATSTIDTPETSKLGKLDQVAWSLWCCGDVPNKWVQKSICRFTWSVMGLICYRHDRKFHGLANLEYTGETDEQIEFICRQTASAINLAFDLELDQNRTHQRHLAAHFSREIDRLHSEG